MFWPERWLVAAGTIPLRDAPPPPGEHERLGEADFVHNDGAFIAFYHGPMGCVGKGLAMQEMRAVVCSLLHQFTIRLAGVEGDGDGAGVHEHREQYDRAYKDYFIATRPAVRATLTRRAW